MAYNLIRPTSEPYNLTGDLLTAFTDWYGIVDPLPTGDLGSLADDSDSTYVSLYSRSNGLSYDSTVVAVDFGPLPPLSANTLIGFGFMVRMTNMLMEFPGSVSWQNTFWGVFDSSWTSGAPNLSGSAGSLEDYAPGTLSDLPTVPTTFTSDDDAYGWLADDPQLAAAYSSGFTVAMAVRINSAGSTLGLLVHEFGLLINLLGRTPPLRRYPAVGNGGFGPTRHYPPPPARRGAGGIK